MIDSSYTCPSVLEPQSLKNKSKTSQTLLTDKNQPICKNPYEILHSNWYQYYTSHSSFPKILENKGSLIVIVNCLKKSQQNNSGVLFKETSKTIHFYCLTRKKLIRLKKKMLEIAVILDHGNIKVLKWS